MNKVYLILVLLLAASGVTRANNVQLANVSIINNGPGNIQVEFDLSWDNSWRTNVGQANYDGVWVFFKYKHPVTGLWTHMTMTGSNNVIPAGVDVYQTNDFQKAGGMIYREAANLGTGTTTLTDVRLGVVSTLPYNIDVRGFAVEMVYIPAPTTRPFFGDGDGTTESTNAFHYTDNTASTGSVVPMRTDANSYDDVDLDGPADGIYVYSNDTIQKTNPLGTLDPFPTMKAIWCMKYEINQAQYRDFLNTLNYTQQVNMTVNAPNSAIGTGALATTGTNRYALEVKTPGVASTTPAVYGCDANANNVYDEAGDGEWIPCGYLLWYNVASYMDWSGLAPMSEFQYERICRGHSSAGPQPAVLGEYAWGTATAFASTYTLTGASTTSEVASNASTTLGNANYTSTVPGSPNNGPLRSGVFATGTSSRITSGAAFFGVMEMSGSLEEYIIGVGTAAGRSVRFVPNGSGNISTNGYAQLSVGGAGFWPGMEGNTSASTTNTCSGTCEVTGNAGIVLKGGSYAHANVSMAIANRDYFAPTSRTAYRGGRAVLYVR
jgi:hypothetical protein